MTQTGQITSADQALQTLAEALGITDAGDYSWDASRLPLSQSPVARRIREQIAENECRRFRAELDGYGMGDAS